MIDFISPVPYYSDRLNLNFGKNVLDSNSSIKKRTGIFISGFRWSGSSAVSDWLESFSAIRKPPDSKSANDEIRALNYGLTLFIRAAEKPLLYGEKLARYSMWPEKKMWKEVFGKPLAAERGMISSLILVLDTLFMAVAAGRLNPGIDAYGDLLCNNLCVPDYRLDRDYHACLRELTEAVRMAIKNAPASWRELKGDARLKTAASGLFALFYDRLSAEGFIPIFDNAFSGLTPRFFDLVDENVFQRQLIVFVIRDPRDQFAEQVKFSTKTFPFMAKKFASDYLKLVSGAVEFANSCRHMNGKIVKVIRFEDFVFDRKNTRSDLRLDIEKMLGETGITFSFDHKVYNPGKSEQNIGLWKASSMKKELTLVEEMIPEYLWSDV